VTKSIWHLLSFAFGGIVTAFSAVAFFTMSCSAQQPRTYTWDQIQDLFLRSNPTLRAQEQSIVSNRAAEMRIRSPTRATERLAQASWWVDPPSGCITG
jgi:hypothetical protein